jgi:hypothetical protein
MTLRTRQPADLPTHPRTRPRTRISCGTQGCPRRQPLTIAARTSPCAKARRALFRLGILQGPRQEMVLVSAPGATEMTIIARWLAAGFVTIAAFVLSTWICGAVALPTAVPSSAVRWSIASALGVAVAALAALWGHSFATAGHSRGSDAERAPSAGNHTLTTSRGTTHNKIVGATIHGSVTQGRDISMSPPPDPRDRGGSRSPETEA